MTSPAFRTGRGSQAFLMAEPGATFSEAAGMKRGIIGISLVDSPLRLHDGEAPEEREPVGICRDCAGIIRRHYSARD